MMRRSPRLLPLLALFALLPAGCSHLRYDLARLPFPVSASPQRGGQGDRFTLTDKHVLWVHGLLGESQPDVQGELLANVMPCAGIAEFRVSSSASFHDWLVSHLTLGLIRMKTVTVTGVRLRPQG